jgi:hypothetical protein
MTGAKEGLIGRDGRINGHNNPWQDNQECRKIAVAGQSARQSVDVAASRR